MSAESLVEAAFRGLMSALVREPSPPRAGIGKRRTRRRSASPAPATPPPEQPMLFDQDPLAPPVTQAELDRMERALRGAPQEGHRVPQEGDNAWMGS